VSLRTEIDTLSAQFGAQFPGIVDHEGGGLFPTQGGGCAAGAPTEGRVP